MTSTEGNMDDTPTLFAELCPTDLCQRVESFTHDIQEDIYGDRPPGDLVSCALQLLQELGELSNCSEHHEHNKQGDGLAQPVTLCDQRPSKRQRTDDTADHTVSDGSQPSLLAVLAASIATSLSEAVASALGDYQYDMDFNDPWSLVPNWENLLNIIDTEQFVTCKQPVLQAAVLKCVRDVCVDQRDWIEEYREERGDERRQDREVNRWFMRSMGLTCNCSECSRGLKEEAEQRSEKQQTDDEEEEEEEGDGDDEDDGDEEEEEQEEEDYDEDDWEDEGDERLWPLVAEGWQKEMQMSLMRTPGMHMSVLLAAAAAASEALPDSSQGSANATAARALLSALCEAPTDEPLQGDVVRKLLSLITDHSSSTRTILMEAVPQLLPFLHSRLTAGAADQLDMASLLALALSTGSTTQPCSSTGPGHEQQAQQAAAEPVAAVVQPESPWVQQCTELLVDLAMQLAPGKQDIKAINSFICSSQAAINLVVAYANSSSPQKVRGTGRSCCDDGISVCVQLDDAFAAYLCSFPVIMQGSEPDQLRDQRLMCVMCCQSMCNEQWCDAMSWCVCSSGRKELLILQPGAMI